ARADASRGPCLGTETTTGRTRRILDPLYDRADRDARTAFGGGRLLPLALGHRGILQSTQDGLRFRKAPTRKLPRPQRCPRSIPAHCLAAVACPLPLARGARCPGDDGSQ